MNSLLKNLLAAKDGGWEQLIILVIIVGAAVIKKIFSSLKAYAEQQSEQQKQQPGEKPKPPPVPGKHGKYTYDRSAFKTLEQLREEKIAQIRAAYGIPQPQQPVIEEPVPVYVPKKITKKHAEAAQAEYLKQEIISQQIKAKTAAQAEQPREMLIRLSSPADLRSAILYQEILSPPLALRQE